MTRHKRKLFLIVWIAGMLGVFSFLFVDLSALIASIPQPPEQPPVALPPPALLKLVSVIQPTVIVTLAVVLGVWLAERVGLHAPAAEAASRGDEFLSKLMPQILPGVVAGLASGVAIILSWVVAKPFLTPEFVTRAQEFNKFLPNITRLLYGGLTEEVLLRWGVMTLIVWAAWRLLQKGQGTPRSRYIVASIVLSAVIFGMGHLPLAAMLSGGLTPPLVIYVIAANSIFGVVAGFLYWLRGLEAAMIAHMSTHLVLILSIYLAF